MKREFKPKFSRASVKCDLPLTYCARATVKVLSGCNRRVAIFYYVFYPNGHRTEFLVRTREYHILPMDLSPSYHVRITQAVDP